MPPPAPGTGITIDLRGLDRLMFILSQARRRSSLLLATALYQEGQVIFARATRYTPVEFGPFRASGYLTMPVVTSNGAELHMGFGGAAAPYAFWVHERVMNLRTGKPIRHSAPTRARFLSTAMEEAAPTIDARLTRRMRGLFAAGGGFEVGQFT